MRFGIRELIFLMVLLAVPVASFLYVFKPRNDEIRQATEEIEIKKAKLNKLSEETQRIEDISIMIERGKERIALIEKKLPSEQDVEGVLGQISQLSDRNKQIIKSIKSEKPIPAAMHMELPLKIVMEGDFDGFYSFLLELENLPRITRIHQLKLVKTQGAGAAVREASSNNNSSMKAEFTLSIYFTNGAGQAETK